MKSGDSLIIDSVSPYISYWATFKKNEVGPSQLKSVKGKREFFLENQEMLHKCNFNIESPSTKLYYLPWSTRDSQPSRVLNHTIFIHSIFLFYSFSMPNAAYLFWSKTPCLFALEFWKIKFEKSSLMNCIFC